MDRVTEKLLNAPTIPCTGCRYCVDGCPEQIKIPDIFRAFNTIKTYGNDMRPYFFYEGLTKDGHKASTCIQCNQCNQCESVCPQHLQITNLISEAAKIFDKK